MSQRKNPDQEFSSEPQAPISDHDDVILLTNLRSQPSLPLWSAPDLVTYTSAPSQHHTEPDIPSIEEDIVLLTRPSSTRLPIPDTIVPTQAQMHAPTQPHIQAADSPDADPIIPLQHPRLASNYALPSVSGHTLENPTRVSHPASSYSILSQPRSHFYDRPVSDQTIDEYDQPSSALHSLETRTALIQPAPDTTPPAHTNLSASLEAISSVLHLDSMPSSVPVSTATLEKDWYRKEETSETELMLNALLGQRSSTTSPEPTNRSSVSLSQITSFLEADNSQYPALSYTKEDFQPSHAYIQPFLHRAYFSDEKYRSQRLAIHTLLEQLTKHCARACCFIPKDGLIVGLAALGQGKMQEHITELIFPADIPSLWNQALHHHQSHWGSLPNTAMDQLIVACFDGILPRQVALFPVLQHGKTVALFYLDDGGEDIFPSHQTVIESLLQHAQNLDFRWFPPPLEDLLHSFGSSHP